MDGAPKTPSSERDVPMGRVLTHYLREWHKQTPYAKPTDFVFPSIKESGRVPICASVFCADHLRPAAKAASVIIPDGHRWGLHNLRHSLSNWLVNKAKENPKTVQGILGHSRIQTTLDLYTDEDLDEMIAAQEKFIDAVGFERETVQWGGKIVGRSFEAHAFQLTEKNGGDDGTRTRGLCRDRAAF